MFNDILTGKGTLEAEPAPRHSPFRPDPGPSDLECPACHRVFPASQAVAGRCRSCAPPVDAALDAMKGPKADYTDHAGADRKRDVGLAILMVAVFAAIVLAVVYAKYQLRQQATAAFQDELSEQLREQARDLELRSKALRATL